MASIPQSLKDEYAILKILVVAVIAASLTYVFIGVAAGYIHENTTILYPDGRIEVKSNTAVAVGITMFNAMAGAGVTFLFLERQRKQQEQTAAGAGPSQPPAG